jgi:transcriptional regulator with XRE-family HTH domain
MGQRIARYRKLNGWSAQHLADNTDGAVSRPTLANLESGRRTDIGLRQFLAICLALRIPPAALLVDLDDPFATSSLTFPGLAPAALEPSAPQIATAQWLNGQIDDTSTPAAEHVQHLYRRAVAELATANADEVDNVRRRLRRSADPIPDRRGTSH